MIGSVTAMVMLYVEVMIYNLYRESDQNYS